MFANADTLLPANMAWELVNHDYAWANQQWPRVPSILDIFLFSLGEFAGLDWRVTTVLYASLVLVAAVLLMAWLAAIIGRRPLKNTLFWTAIAVTGALLLTAAGSVSSGATGEGWYLPIIALLPVSHGNALLLSFLAFCVSPGALAGYRVQAIVVYLACVVGAFSDALYYVYFLGPFIFALLVTSVLPICAARRQRPFEFANAPNAMAGRAFLLKITLASVIGSLLQLPLRRQDLPGAEIHFHDFSPASVATIATSTIWSSISFAVLVTAVASTFVVGIRNISQQKEMEFEPSFIVLAGAASCMMSAMVMLALHTDTESFRYALPLLWWPFIFAVALVRWPSAIPTWITALLAVPVAGAFVPSELPVLLSWRSPLERCLHTNAGRFGLRAGLASYWYSRPTMASSDWTLQVDQVTGDGSIYIWGNDEAAYQHDMLDSSRAPAYNFVVMDASMVPKKLVARWGQPAARFSCGELEIWTYNRTISPPPAPGSREAE